jgi:hypothetical protein
MPPSLLARCKRHPTATAGWRCEDCGAPLCPECVEVRRMQTVDLLSCRACRGRAETLLLHRSQLRPFASQLGQAWRYPFTQYGLAMAVGLGAVLSLLGIVTDFGFILVRWIPALLSAGIFWGSLFAIIRASARGEMDVPIPDFVDFLRDWLMPALRGVLATSVMWLPLGAWLVLSGGWDVFQQLDRLVVEPMFYLTGRFPTVPGETLLHDPVAWLLGLASLAYLPMALLLTATGASMLDMLNPVTSVRAMLRFGRDYALALGALLALGLAFLVVQLLGSGLRSLPVPFVTRWLAESLECLVPFMMAHVLGLLVYTRGDVLGYGASSDYLTPVLPDALPHISLRMEDSLPPVPTADTPGPAAQVRALARAVEARDVTQALALYLALDVLPRSAIPPALHLFVGQASAAQGDYALAVRSLESAADVAPDDPLAPRALVLLARVLGERMQEATRAQDVYRYIVDRYPDTDASRFARARLPPTT